MLRATGSDDWGFGGQSGITIKDFRKSQAAKAGWKRHRYNFMKGINRFHGSTEGKRFHRNLGNYLALTDTSKGTIQTDRTRNEDLEFLKSVNSALTHGVIELEYYEGVYENLEYELFYEEEFCEILQNIVHKISNSESLDKDELDYLYRIVEQKSLLQAISNESDKSVEVLLEYLEPIKKGLVGEFDMQYDESEKGYYLAMYNQLKRKVLPKPITRTNLP